MRKLLLASAVCLALGAAAAPASQAAVFTIGNPLTGTFVPTAASSPGTVVLTGFPGATIASPVDGTVIRWRLLEAEGGDFRLRIMRANGAGEFTGVGTGPAVQAGSAILGVQTFPAALPIKAGDLIGFDVTSGSARVGTINPSTGARFETFGPPFPDGQPRVPDNSTTQNIQLGFNADVLPAPTLSVAKPASGSFTGGAKVTITGTDLTEVSAVTFGGLAAKSFASVSETSLTAVAPKVAKPAKVDLAVTTPAGTATLPQAFQFKACKVPSLRGKTLKKAKKKLKKAGCKIGKVTRVPGGAGKVTKQKPPAGKLKAAGAKVKVTLG